MGLIISNKGQVYCAQTSLETFRIVFLPWKCSLQKQLHALHDKTVCIHVSQTITTCCNDSSGRNEALWLIFCFNYPQHDTCQTTKKNICLCVTIKILIFHFCVLSTDFGRFSTLLKTLSRLS